MTDIIVIGGGIAGLSAGARLSQEAQVTVLERESSTGYHASGRSAALFEEQYGLPSTIALNTASRDYHMTAHGGYLSPRGLMILGKADERDAFDADAKMMQVETISIEDACAMVPVLNRDVTAYAGYHEAAYDIDTDRMMQDFIREIRAGGGQVLAKSPVTAITRTGAGWRI